MLENLLKSLEKEAAISFDNGVYHVRVGATFEISCTEENGMLRFESPVTPIPPLESNRLKLLNVLLQRSARMARYRQERICIDSQGELVLLQRTLPSVHSPVTNLVVVFHDFIRALDAWRALADKAVQYSPETTY